MAGKPRKKLPSKSSRVKAIARQRVGTPKPARAIEDKPTRRKPKHKKSWQEETTENHS
jgi:hypothetical protein